MGVKIPPGVIKKLAFLRRQSERDFPIAVGHIEVCKNLSVSKAKKFGLQVRHGEVVRNHEEIDWLEVDDEPELRAGLWYEKRCARILGHLVRIRRPVDHEVVDGVTRERFLLLGVLVETDLNGFGIGRQLDVELREFCRSSVRN